MTARVLLAVTNLEVTYHRHALAVQGVSFRVPEHGFVTILGTNGAGKSTILQSIAGFLQGDDVELSDGRVDLADEPITGLAPEEVSKRGVALVPERDKVFQTLTVDENLTLSQRAGSGPETSVEDVYDYFPVLADRRRQLAGYLSGGERQMLAIGSALLGRPRLLLVDELSLGLAPKLVSSQMAMLRRLREEVGLAILLVEQNASAALSVAEYGYVLESGRIVFEGSAADLESSEDVRDSYLGGEDRHRSYRDVKQYRRKRRWFG